MLQNRTINTPRTNGYTVEQLRAGASARQMKVVVRSFSLPAYLVVVPSSQAGAEYVLATGRPVLYAGGFSGSDPVIDGAKLAQLVAKGEVRYVLWGGGGPGGRGGSTGTSITSYLQSSCKVVTDPSLGTAASTGTQGAPGGFGSGPGGASTLYQCGS